MDKLIDHLSSEWDALSQAPLDFVIFSVLVLMAAYALARWRYGSVVEQLRATNETLRERIHLKDEQVDQYRSRALQLEDKHMEVVDTTEEALRDKALGVVRGIRDIKDKYHSAYEEATINVSRDQEDRHDDDDEQRQLGAADPLMRIMGMALGEYSREYKVDAILLRDELRTRLSEYQPDPMTHDMLYEHPTNFFGLEGVATDLERMAKTLTSK
ncbi:MULTISPECIES: hypothetical protein [Halomonadaceae]|uniref:hypothetical protein n=1 Tax=Halomonadaceae TaxID=28256 RepID=UPI00159B7635|nr:MULTISPECIES: hypothetical protein [Halomonas]QJQ95384.1 hypothetical protein HIO72_08930 [Halomonas sp. PA5]